MASQGPPLSYHQYCELIAAIVNPRRPPRTSPAHAIVSLWLHDLQQRRPYAWYSAVFLGVRQDFLRLVGDEPLDGDVSQLPRVEELEQRAVEAYQERRVALLGAQDLIGERDREHDVRTRRSRSAASRDAQVADQRHVDDDNDVLQPYTPGARSSSPHHEVLHPHALTSRGGTPTGSARHSVHGSRPSSRSGDAHLHPPSHTPHDSSGFVRPAELYLQRPSFELERRGAPYPTSAQRRELVWQEPEPDSSAHDARAHDPHEYRNTHFDEAWEHERAQ
ncbi:hypothetical protein JCM8208_007036 [Rhodotorula glutinis]